ncbi:hypothetical protein BGX26_006358 [Mortierella sp. AD094]|nr:hypothetical protein BGX26_006358 [Mortierella sp. AD094]
MRTFLTRASFKSQASRYLVMLVQDEPWKSQLRTAFEDYEDDTTDWEECEKIFFHACLTEEQRSKDTEQITSLGRCKKESYCRNTARICRHIRCYGVQDSNDYVLAPLIRNFTGPIGSNDRNEGTDNEGVVDTDDSDYDDDE